LRQDDGTRSRIGMPHTALDSAAIEAEREGRLRRVRTALGVTAFGINELRLPPGASGSLHDESATGQEEVYYVLEGSGTMAVDGEEVELRPGRYVFVAPGTPRQLTAGDDGLTWLCIGCPAGAYRPRS
jgi:mannose-6-phosphate isomerase-like protein (cupin superfamily)